MTRRGNFDGRVKWTSLTWRDQCRINANRHAFGLPPRLITAVPEVILSSDEEDSHVPDWVSV